MLSATPSIQARHQPRRGEGEAEGTERRRHQPVGERWLVEEGLAAVTRDEGVAAFDHGPRGVHEVDLGALEGRRAHAR